MSKKLAMVVDTERCIGCNACTIECRRENEVPFEGSRTVIKESVSGSFPDVSLLIRKAACLHCKEAICVDVCPTGATYQRKDGVVVIDKERCIGCGYCVNACPYQARFLEKESQKANKCNFCAQRLSKGLEPICVTKCPQSALLFGDRDEMLNKAKDRLQALKAKGKLTATLYGERELGGQGVIYILTDKPSSYGLPEEPIYPNSIAAWQQIIKPLGAIAGGLTLAGLAVSFLANLGYQPHSKEGGEE